MNKEAKIYIAGHRGLVGSAILRQLKKEGYENIITRSHQKLDLIRQAEVEEFFAEEKLEYVFLAAARVGGIYANSTYKADFIYQNIQVQNNVIHQSYVHGVKKLLFLGSSCIYPKHCPQPMKEEYLLTGELEPTNDAYAIAKIAGIKMCQSYNQQYETNFISVMPTNLYGPYDNFDLKNAHVLPAMLRKFHEAKENGHTPVELWGSGTPRREFVYSEDMADACLHVMRKINTGDAPGDLYNIGSGLDLTIKELALKIQATVGHQGGIHWDASQPDGTFRKLQDVSRLSELGWNVTTGFKEGLQLTYDWFCQNLCSSERKN
jgi:GDP-L-fucose synthase